MMQILEADVTTPAAQYALNKFMLPEVTCSCLNALQLTVLAQAHALLADPTRGSEAVLLQQPLLRARARSPGRSNC